VQSVEPLFVGEVSYRSWTPDGRMRHPSWRGLRPDRRREEVNRLPALASAETPEVVEGTMATPDGHWHVDVVRRSAIPSYRVSHGDNTLEVANIDDVQRIPARAGVDLSDLTEAGRTRDSRRRASGDERS
jgi:bifunctional non-homologous end joining protein LigD